MRIAQITATFPPYQGGTGNVCFYNSKQLALRGHDVQIYTAAVNDAPNFEEIEGVHVRRMRPIFQIGNAPLLPGLLHIEGFDIIHLHYPFIFGSELTWLLTRFHKIPYVFTYHNDLIGKGVKGFLFNIYLAMMAPPFFKGADKIITVSKNHAKQCKTSHLFINNWMKVVEIPNGVDVSTFHPNYDGRLIRQNYGIPETSMVILFIGGLDRAHYYKGLEILLNAFTLLQNHKYKLLIVGDGDLRDYYKKLSGALNIQDSVIFLGRLQHKDLPLTIAASDLLVLPSQEESFGMVLIEAMACGKPVIASNITGIRSIVTNGEDGYLVPPGDVGLLSSALQSLLEQPELRHQMGLAGIKKVTEKYTWGRITDLLEQVYSSVLF